MLNKILFCTVGGSHQPIVDAINHHQPDKVVFVCSEDDATSGNKGTYRLIVGDGMVCKTEFSGPDDLPNIPSQVGLEAEQVEVMRVPSDRPDAVIERVWPRIRQAADQSHEVVADYTGGTKSMSGGLMFAAINADDVELSLVTGPRSDHNRVVTGQATEKRSVEWVQNRWRLQEASDAWKRRDYAEAARLLERSGADNVQIRVNRVLSQGFEAWDRFNHRRAYELLTQVARHVPDGLMEPMGIMKKVEPTEFTRAHQIWDLYLMSRRRAQAKRYGTAVLLTYRAFEWIAQWTLRYHHDIDTGDVSDDIAARFPDYVNDSYDGASTMGSENAWRVITELDGPLAEVGRATEKSRATLARKRNKSVFAHGFEPLDEADYQQALAFFDDQVKPAFVEVAFGQNPPFGQLPDELPTSATRSRTSPGDS